MEFRTSEHRVPRKHPGASLRDYRVVFLETGCIIAMLLLIGLLRADVQLDLRANVHELGQPVPVLEAVVQTQLIGEPATPIPPRPQPPVTIAEEVVLAEEPLEVDAEIHISEPAPIPPPPIAATRTVQKEREHDPFLVVEQMPILIGGMKRLNELLRYPASAVEEKKEGLVIVEFFVEVDGHTSEARVVKSAGDLLDRMALEAVEKLEFILGEQRDIPVRVKVSLPVRFRLVSTRLV